MNLIRASIRKEKMSDDHSNNVQAGKRLVNTHDTLNVGSLYSDCKMQTQSEN